MSFRLLVFGALLLAAALALLLVPLGRSPEELPVVEAAEQAPAPEAAALGDVPLAELRTEIDPAGDGASRPERVESSVRSSARLGEQVLVRVFLARADGTEASFEGHQVTAQSWIGETGDTFLHHATADASGVAELMFPGEVHIDFVRYDPPAETAFAIAVAEKHIDLSPGTVFEESLEIEPGGFLEGRVLQADGFPAAGVELHAYDGGVWSDLDDWDPGLVSTTTASDGTYRFPGLPAGEWGIAVRPTEWLQIDPNLGRPEEGKAQFEVRVGERVIARDFRVLPLHRFELTITDQNGMPLPSMRLVLSPRAFRSPYVLLARRGRGQPEALDRFLRGEPAGETGGAAGGFTWHYGSLNWSTDDAGKASCFAVAGHWELSIATEMDRNRRSGSAHRVPLQVPCGDRTLAMPQAFWRFDGQVVDLEGAPVPGARAHLIWRRSGRTNGDTTRSDKQGLISFPALSPLGDYRLHVETNNHLPGEWPIVIGETAEPRRFEMRPSRRLVFRAVDPAGEPLRSLNFRLISGHPELPEVPLRAGEISWLERAKRSNRARRSGRDGTVSMSGLLPGTYEVGLLLPFATGEVDSRGRPRTEQQVYRSWHLETQAEPQVITVDMSGYLPPQTVQLAAHQGVVLDANTLEPVYRARVQVQSSRYRRTTVSGRDGRFGADAPPGPATFYVTANGYFPRSLSVQTAAVGTQEHQILLRPGGHDVRLKLLDRDGAPLPDVEVNFRDAAGRRLQCLVPSRPGRGPSWRSRAVTREGSLVFSGVPPGELRLEIEFWGHTLSEARAEISGGTEPQNLTIYLNQTLAEIRAALAQRVESDD